MKLHEIYRRVCDAVPSACVQHLFCHAFAPSDAERWTVRLPYDRSIQIYDWVAEALIARHWMREIMALSGAFVVSRGVVRGGGVAYWVESASRVGGVDPRTFYGDTDVEALGKYLLAAMVSGGAK